MTEFNEIFNEELFKDLTQLKQNVPQVHTEFIISNLLASVSLFTNNRFFISPKNHPKTSTNLYIMNVSSKPFINTLGTMQKNERELSKIEKKFAENCRAREREASETLTSDQKNKIAEGLLYSNPIYKTFGVNIDGWTTSHTSRPEFFITDFSPEALTKINTSKNHTGYIYSDEYDKLISSVTRTKTVNDPHQFFTSLFDGEHVSIIRKNSDSESIDITLTLMINTTTSNFKDSVNKNGFFHNGFGARLLYVFNNAEYERIDIIPSVGLTLEEFNNKIYRLLDNLYEYYYKNEDVIEFVIPENLFSKLNEIEKTIDITLDNSELNENIITTYKTRIHVMLMKLISLIEIINVTYNQKRIKEPTITVTEDMIIRGGKLLTFFVSNFINLFGAKNALKPDQEALMAQLTKGRTYDKEHLLTLTSMSESTLRRFLETRTDLFTSEIIEKKKIYKVL
jgi:hypothetical protein